MNDVRSTEPMPEGVPSETDIAIVGLGLHLPGADGPDAFWANLRAGISSIRPLSRATLIEGGEAPHLVDRPDYVPFAADLPAFAAFDASFWGLSPKDAAVMDPQHRQFLEASWEALENAGHVPERFAGRIGVFAGCGQGTYYHRHVLTNPDLVEGTGLFLLRHTGNDKDFLATRLSHMLDLRGPSINVQTACSTSLVATHLACQSLLGGECDMALAGGVTVELPQARGYLYREGEILSPDGACHAFDHRAAGTVFGSGAAVAVLRRLSDALADGDHVWAVIKGTAVNNDGARKSGYLAPSVDGQADCIREAQVVAQVAPGSIAYVECHGTGTYLGDPIEVAALAEAFGQLPEGTVRIGSVKTNIGHTDTAAGTASLAKAALALHHGEIPPSLGYEAPNPAIPFAGSPFRVADRLEPWPEGPRRAAVNSLGVGGTNAHAVLEAAPARGPSAPGAFPFHLLTLSARSKPALDDASRRLAAHLRANPEQPLADVAWTLHEGRRAFPWRRALVAATHEEAAALLDAGDPRRVFTHQVVGDAPEVVFMLPGGGAQHVGMARDLYDTEPVFQDWMDRGLAHLAPLCGYDPREAWLPAPGREAWAAERLLMPSVQLPLLMIVEYALAQLWRSWGVHPTALIGHSMGENTAAALADVMTFEDCIGLVHLRGTLFDEVAPGGMLSVALPASDLRAHLGPDLDLAAENAPRLSVASGPRVALDALAARLEAAGIDCQPIPIAIAAHSRMLEPILGRFEAHLRSISLKSPTIPIVSNRTGQRLTDAEATDPAYWTAHLRGTIRFADGLSTLAAENPARVYIEVGPGRALASLAGQHGRVTANQVLGSLRHQADDVADDAWFQAMLGRLWATGGAFDWAQVWGGEERQRVPLPTYPFERQDYLIQPGAVDAAPASTWPLRVPEIADWGWAPRWTPRYAPGPDLADEAALALGPRETWLILEDEAGLGRDVASRLRAMGHAAVTARAGDRYARLSDDAWVVPPERGREATSALLRDLGQAGVLPSRVLHLWLVTEGMGHRPGSSFFHRTQEQGFWSLLALAESWAEEAGDRPLHLVTVTSGAAQVRAEPLPDASKATVLGPAMVIPREFPGATSAVLDIDPAMDRPRLVEAILEEALATPASGIAALRSGRRLERGFAPVPLPDASGPTLRQGGPVLITGGFGGIGLTLAAALAARAGAPIVLVGRTPLPPRETWDAILRQGGGVADRVRAVRALEAGGARVLPVAADVANLEEMRAAVTLAEAAFGPVSGVVHAAGVIDDAPILGRDLARIEDVLAPKVQGAQVLQTLFPDGALDWMALLGSSSTATGPAGQADYVAANAYLDALARAAEGGRTRVVAIDWGVWQGVGMAAGAMAARLGTTAAPEPLDLPLLDATGLDADGHRRLTATWVARERWVLDEHRTTGGDAVLPGTGVLELAAEVVAAQGEAMPFVLRDLAFLRPLRAPDDAPVSVRLTLKRSDVGYDMMLESAAPGQAFEANAEASLDLRAQAAPRPLDLAAIRARLDGRPTGLTPAPGGSLAVAQEAHLAFGPRWRTLREARLGPFEGLARLTLPPTGGEGMALHPGLLDLATGWAMALVPDYAPTHLWVPLAYAAVRVHAPLGAEVLSHVRLASSGQGTAAFDVTLTDPDGRVLVEIEGFTMRRLDAGLAFAAPRPAAADGPRPLSPLEERLAHNIRQGIEPQEGAEAFLRVLASGRSQIIVSSLPIPALLAQADAVEARPAGGQYERPTGAGEIVRPEGGIETRLAAIWSDLLGVAEVGAEDSFFDLGGHSLIAVRLFAQVRKAFGVDLPISALFEAPTIRACARLIEARGGTAPGAAPAAGMAPVVLPVRPRFTHVVPMHQGEGGPRAPFFLVAGMFGNVLNLRHLAHLVGQGRPVYGLQARGLTGDAPPHARLDEAARDMLAEMRQVQGRGPWLLGGFSGGGITAYEIARQLRAQGEEVAALILLDTPLPQRRPLTPRDRAAIQWLELRRDPAYPIRWATRRVAWEIAKRRGHAPDDAPEGFQDAAIESAFYAAIAAYRMEPWAGPLTLLRPPLHGQWEVGPGRWVSSERAYVLPDNDWTPWAPRTQVVEVPGDHDSMVLEPNVRVLAARLRRIIEAAERSMPAGPSPVREAAE